VRRGALALALALLAGFAAGAGPAPAATEPLFVFSPQPLPPPEPWPSPDGYLNGPCGLALDSTGRFYVADRYHDAVDAFTSAHEYVTQLRSGLEGPCGLAVDPAGRLYVNSYHRGVRRYGASPSFGAGTAIDPGPATGVAVDPATGDIYVDKRTHLAAYDPSGAPVEEGGEPLRIGESTLKDGYGLAVSGFEGDSEHASTAGYLYVPDAAADTVKVYDPATGADPVEPAQTIDGDETPNGAFTSLRDSAVAVDDATGEIYVLDDLQSAHAEQPKAVVWVFSPSGAYEGHLEYEVVDGAPTGLAVDNSGGAGGEGEGEGGRVYVTSGNTHHGGLYAYAPGSASTGPPAAPTIPPPPLGGSSLFPFVPIGGPVAGGGGIVCRGDGCQALPPEPVDPTLTTTLPGRGNPKVHYVHQRRRRKRRRHRHRRHRHHRHGRKHRARASSVAGLPPAASPAASGGASAAAATGPPAGPEAASAPAPIEAGFEASAWDADGGPASLAGSHPYELEFSLGLDQGGGAADLREATIELPEGLLADPAATGLLCSAAAFSTPRSSPFEASASGESCPASSQVGTLEVETPLGGGQRRRFGVFDLDPAEGFAIQLGASPFGKPIVLGGRIGADGRGAALTLSAALPAALHARGLRLSVWGVPWDASHNGQRGDCLDEAEPSFAWASCSVGDPLLDSQHRPLAFLTLPARCGAALAFTARARSWQGTGGVSRPASTAPLTGCGELRFEPLATGLLTVRKASSASGFVFGLTGEDPGLANPRSRIHSLPGAVRVELPKGVTLNPSLGAGLRGCEPSQYAAEAPSTAPGAGCPDGSKIGEFDVRSPFYEGFLEGAVYLAEPYRNPFGSLLAVYLVANSADRGILVKAAGRVDADPTDGSLTATFEGLPQLPYEELEVKLRTGQRAPLVSPPACGPATTRIELSPAAQGAPGAVWSTDSPIETGIEAGPCPDGSTPPFAPGVVAGGVNSNVGSYTPYFVHLSRRDSEQEITSYSLVLPRGIVGKLAGVAQCTDAAIAAARANGGFAEAAGPSCPAAAQVGRTLTGYGVGSALTYAEGGIYLAGPYHGSALSLVTVNPATIGPFDLGTIVVRSAFDVDPHSAQLRIDSRASDPIPHILDGIPLHLRDIRVYMDRPEFTRNPTSCEPSQLESALTGSGTRFDDPSDDSSATASERFQLLDCLELGFRPKLGLRLRGRTRRGGYPALRATFAARAGDADLKRIEVDMPHQLFLAQSHIRGVCTRAQFAAGACPPGSVYGRAVAYTPLLDQPLRGEVYLRSSEHKLPDLVADLRSGTIRIVLEGRIGPSGRGGIRAFFDDLPDAPIERFTMLLRGGRHGLLVNSVDVCRRPPAAAVKALGQNDVGLVFTSVLRGRCHHEKKRGKKGRRGLGGKRR
jgi:hypothetical protein